MISVIIPTFNRCQSLIRTLASLEQQNFALDHFEVIVIDDGSSDDTDKYAEEFLKYTRIKMRYYSQPNSGPAKARNLGITKAEGDIILFCGDDTICDKGLLRQHENSHQRAGVDAVLGLVSWDPGITPTDFMNFLAPAGPQFHFNTIRNNDDAGFHHCYASNISLKKKCLLEEKFDERFKHATFEDIDLGLRLENKGVKITYNKDAIVYHSHYYPPEVFYQRMIKVGESFVIFRNKYKNDNLRSLKICLRYAPFLLFPFGLKSLEVLSGITRRSGFIEKIAPQVHWWLNVSYFYSTGIRKGLNEKRD